MKRDSRRNNIEFYNGKKVLVTGHTGFKGAWLTCILDYFGADASGYALLPERNCLYEQINGSNIIKNYTGYLEDFEHLKGTIKLVQPEIVIHLAAYGFINECYRDPRNAYSTNIMGTVNLLEAVRQCETIRSVVVLSTDKVYENKGDGAIYVEGDVLGGCSPYSCSKTCMEFIVRDYYDTYFKEDKRKIGIGVVRASNVLAGGDHIQTRLIPSILRSIDEGIPVELRNPDQTRPWQAVVDALDGYLTIARYLYMQPEDYSGVWNIGPKIDGIKSVQWIFDKMVLYFNGLEKTDTKGFRVHETATLGLDITKAMSRLDWEPRISIDRVMELIVNFYKGKKKGRHALTLCREQIREYYGGTENALE